jgi:HemY protein
LFLEAEREGEREAARQFAERALRLNPKLGWPVEALFDLQCRAGNWPGALETLAVAERQHLVDRATARRRRAVLLAGQALALEDAAPERALELALEAHGLARDLVPAAAVAGRVLASRGKTPKAARVLLRTWRKAPHPDLAVAYAYARPGDSPRDRVNRVRQLARVTPNHPEALIAVATSAVEARAWDEAREALKPLVGPGDTRLTARVCALMARIEGEQYGDAGRVREWLARAAGAGRDPAWIAEGVAYGHWSPVSPATGQIDAMRWGAPEEAASATMSAAALAARLEAALGLSLPGEARVEAAPPPEPPAKPAAPLPAGEPGRMEAGAQLPPAAREAPVPARIEPPPSDMLSLPDVPFKEGPKSVPVEPVTAPARPRPRKPAEPKVFVPPRAPDDPGTDPPGLDDLQGYPTKA